jgi:hypothetical protein
VRVRSGRRSKSLYRTAARWRAMRWSRGVPSSIELTIVKGQDRLPPFCTGGPSPADAGAELLESSELLVRMGVFDSNPLAAPTEGGWAAIPLHSP